MSLHLPEVLAGLEVAFEDPLECPPARWGILGAGGIARQFIRDAREATACDVVAIGSRSRERAAEFAAEYSVPRAYGSYADLVASDAVDAVYVATPHSEHRDHAILALEAGKPVLVEKSFARNAAEAREVFAAARRQGLFAMEAMWSRFLPHMTVARAIVASGTLGRITAVAGDHGQDLTHIERLTNPALAGGALLDLGVYPLSFIHSILGIPQQVRATGHLLDTGVDSSSVSTLVYPDALAVATATLTARTACRAWIAGTAGRIDFDPDFYRPGGITITLAEREEVRWEMLQSAGGFEFQIAEVARCLDDRRTESPVMPWDATVEVLEIMDEVRRQVGVRYPGEQPAPGPDDPVGAHR